MTSFDPRDAQTVFDRAEDEVEMPISEFTRIVDAHRPVVATLVAGDDPIDDWSTEIAETDDGDDYVRLTLYPPGEDPMTEMADDYRIAQYADETVAREEMAALFDVPLTS